MPATSSALPRPSDLPGEIARIAAFLDIDIDIDPAWAPAILEHCGFDWMKAHAGQEAPLGGVFWDGGAETFINKGTNGRWRDVLTAEDNAEYGAPAPMPSSVPKPRGGSRRGSGPRAWPTQPDPAARTRCGPLGRSRINQGCQQVNGRPIIHTEQQRVKVLSALGQHLRTGSHRQRPIA